MFYPSCENLPWSMLMKKRRVLIRSMWLPMSLEGSWSKGTNGFISSTMKSTPLVYNRVTAISHKIILIISIDDDFGFGGHEL